MKKRVVSLTWGLSRAFGETAVSIAQSVGAGRASGHGWAARAAARAMTASRGPARGASFDAMSALAYNTIATRRELQNRGRSGVRKARRNDQGG